MDKKVIGILLILIILLATIFAIMFFKSPRECIKPDINYSPAKPKAREQVTFTCDNYDDKKIKWNVNGSDFGIGKEATHTFDNAATYKIQLSVEDKCDSTISLLVESEKPSTVTPVVILPSVIHVNEPAAFSDATKDASSWSWSVKEMKQSFTTQSCKITFNRPGRFIIHLTIGGKYVNGDTAFAVNVQRAIAVAHKESAPQTTVQHNSLSPTSSAPKGPTLAEQIAAFDAKFKNDFVDIANQLTGGEAGDLWRDAIVSKVCNQTMNIIITDNRAVRSEITISLESFRKKLAWSRGQPPYTVIRVNDVPNQVNDIKDICIKEITVVVDYNN